jgi:hypothetical protein
VSKNISKTNEDAEFFNALLDEVRINGTERLRAKASFERAEAFADAVVACVNLVKRLLNTLVLRPYHRLTTQTG